MSDPSVRSIEVAERPPDEGGAKDESVRTASPRIVRFGATMHDPQRRRLADLPDRVVEGDPRHESVTRYASPDGALQTGTWKSTPGRWRVFDGRDEFCTLLEGRAALIASDGTKEEFGPGDSFLIPNGFEGFWDVTETALKHFVILHREGGK